MEFHVWVKTTVYQGCGEAIVPGAGGENLNEPKDVGMPHFLCREAVEDESDKTEIILSPYPAKQKY